MTWLLPLASLASVSSLVAQASPGLPDLWAPLLNLGTAGLFIGLFAFGKIHSEKEVVAIRKDRDEVVTALRKERDEAVADSRTLRNTLIDQTVPAMTRMTEVATRATEALMKGPRQ